MDQDRITKKVRQGEVNVDYDESTLVVNYEIEKVAVDVNGRVLQVISSKQECKRIKIKQLAADKNIAQLSNDIVEKCSYIHPSRTEEVEQLLIRLRKHQQQIAAPSNNDNGRGDRDRDRQRERGGGPGPSERDERERSSRDSGREERRVKERSDRNDNRNDASVRSSQKEDDMVRRRRQQEREREDVLPPANIDDIDEYLDMLYQVSGKSEEQKAECTRIQVRGTGMILLLCRDVLNLETLIQNSTVMGALTRVLAEEYKKSTELTFNILRIFLSFSNFSEMHGLMANYKVGMLTMKAIEYEVKRFAHRAEEKEEREARYAAIVERAAEGGDEQAGKERVRKLRENDNIKGKLYQQKQEKMCFVAFYILLNVAEDIGVERKMLNKDLMGYLESMLERSNGDLLVLSVSFLKKLSVYAENKELMKNSTIVHRLGRFLPCSSGPLVQMTLQLLFNLSFDREMRSQMLKAGHIPKLIALLKMPPYRGKTLKLLYHLSVDDRCKSMITYGEGVPMIMGLIMNFPAPLLARELAALAVNLSHFPKNAEAMVGNRGLNHLMDRLDNDYQERDQGLLKIIRNISYWTFTMQEQLEAPEDYRYRGIWAPHFKLILEMLTDTDNQDVMVELFGTLANMTTNDVPANTSWNKLCKEYNLVSLFSKMLIPGMAQNDLILEIIMLISAIAGDVNACDTIASSNLIGLLYQTWKEKSEDVEIKLQLIYCFHRLFSRESSRDEAMYSTRIVVDIIDCLSDGNAAVRSAADDICDLVLEHDRKIDGELGQLGLQIRKKRFEGYNGQFLAHSGMGSGSAGVLGGGHMSSTYEDEDDLGDSDDFDMRHGLGASGGADWKNMIRQQERLALDMDELGQDNNNNNNNNRSHERGGGRMNDDMPSSDNDNEQSGNWEEGDESGRGWP